MLLTATDYNDNLRAAGIIGCAYGSDYSNDCGTDIPILSLAVKHPHRLKLAFDQFRAWIDATGPDALRVEILYKEEGYYLALGPDGQHSFWRTVGLGDPVDRPLIGLTYIKPIDSRQRLLENISEYCSSPIAPIYLGGVHYVGPDDPGSFGDPWWLRPIHDLPPILLLNLAVYKKKEDVPHESGLISRGNMPDRDELVRLQAEHQQKRTSPVALSRVRESQLQSIVPTTLHLLRTDATFVASLRDMEKSGFKGWQLEQAAINQRFWRAATAAGQYRLKRSDTVPKFLENFLELDTPPIDGLLKDSDAIIAQAKRDAVFLLKKLGENGPRDDVAVLQGMLEARGYLERGGPP